ncbi:tachykinin-like peptides receptor 86C [Actinia tenebrosa]|uniref:Tachykinin-like peptides receptor 86C n=1 Tax=Actinia tenebrosa TaxID=6105 RepID=A0A6P8IXE4_ACTTE|nr:tachykinin-like peptides receptor 86C [Actinia tenebrosa]
MRESHSDTALNVLFSASFALNIAGNSIICYTILHKRSLRTTMNILFVNLSIADMTVGLFMSPWFIFIKLFQHPTGNPGLMLCTFLTGQTLMLCGGVVSFCTLLSISIERYYAIIHPHSYKGRLSTRKVRIIIILSWVFGILWVVPQMLTRKYSEEKQFCVGDWPKRWHVIAYSICWLLIAFVIPVCIMAAIYLRIINALWRTGNKTVNICQRVRMRSRKRLTKIMIAITIIYCCCWAPVTIFYCVSSFVSTMQAGSLWHKVGILMVTLNSSINPVLYSYQSNQLKIHIKKTMKNLLCCFIKRGRVDVVRECQPRAFVGNNSTLTTRLT